eukprot:gene6192-6428_t
MQVARIEDNIVVATSSSTGAVCLLLMQLPPVPQATSADLQFVAVSNDSVGDSHEDDHLLQQQPATWLHEVQDLHDVPASSVDINSTRQQQNLSAALGVTQVQSCNCMAARTVVVASEVVVVVVASKVVVVVVVVVSLLSVAGDGRICIMPLADLDQGGGEEYHFKAATGWSGYRQARWMDSQTFATAGVLGGLQLWDVRQGPQPIRCSPLSWGATGCAALDANWGHYAMPSAEWFDAAMQQLIIVLMLSASWLASGSARPNMAATGASGGGVALWDLRFTCAPLTTAGGPQAAGDVWEVKFDPCEPLMSSAVAPAPPLLYCTADGSLCHAAAARKPSSNGGNWGAPSATSGLQDSANSSLQATVLQHVPCAINSFDIEPSFGQDIMAVTDFEGMMLLHRAMQV